MVYKTSTGFFCLNKPAPRSIVIVGGGASATLLLAQLSIQLNAHSASPINIYIIDNSQAFKVGIAYNIEHPSFVLNVAANRMGAFPDKPEDFYHWLIDQPTLWRNLHADFKTIEFQSTDFVPRMIYGAYLRWVFDQALATAHGKNISIHRVVARVTKINTIENTKRLQVVIDTEEVLNADTVILATGNSTQNHQDLVGSHVFSSPYCKRFLQQDWSSVNDVILLGSGLSMVDAVQYLTQQNYKGKIHVFSRTCLIPLSHAEENHSQAAATFDDQVFSAKDLNSAKAIVRKLRKQIDLNEKNGISWQATINTFRSQVNSIWLSLNENEQKKLQRFLPWWNIARHRIPAAAREQLIRLQQEGRLIINKGNIKKAESDGEYFLLKINNKTLFIKSEKMVICSGYNYRFDHLLDVCGDLIGSKKQLQKHLGSHESNHSLSRDYSIYALGPSLANTLFETTAIHEIRQQSKLISADIATQYQHLSKTCSAVL